MNSYLVGNIVRLSGAFYVSTVLTDPTVITLDVRAPSGTVTNYVVAGGQIVRDGTGLYHYDLTLSAPREWWYRWTGTGTCPAVGEAGLEATASRVS